MPFAVVSSDGVMRSTLPDVTVPEQDLSTFVWSKAANYAEQQALTCGETGRSYSYTEARSLSHRFGASLLRRGFGPGDVLVIFLPNSIEYPLILLGALEAGLLVTMIDASYKKNEVLQQVQTADAKVIVTVTSLIPMINEVLKDLSSSLCVIVVDADNGRPGLSATWTTWSEMVDSSEIQQKWPKVSPEAIAFLPCSSGTTSERKMVARTHKATVAGVAMTPLLEHDVNVVISTLLCHAAAQSFTLLGLTSGANCLILPSRDPHKLIEVLTILEPLSVIWLCPSPYFSDLNPLVKTDDLKSLHSIVCVGCSFAPAAVEEFLDKMPDRDAITFTCGFAMTEAFPIIIPQKNNLDPTVLGYPAPNTELKVVGADGKNLGPGQAGELYIRGPQVMKCYYNNEEATTEAFDGEWFKSGDIVYYDETGMFHLVGRSKELIKCNGRSVSPLDLEIALTSHPTVKEAGVIGVLDDITVEKTIAFVVPKSGMEIDIEELKRFVSSEVAPHKTLRQIIVIEALPRNSAGKVMKRVLKERCNLMLAEERISARQSYR
nr:PREDICTED: probable 4-coumarate--CoA ligase 3 [Bemisia tabaci]